MCRPVTNVQYHMNTAVCTVQYSGQAKFANTVNEEFAET